MLRLVHVAEDQYAILNTTDGIFIMSMHNGHVQSEQEWKDDYPLISPTSRIIHNFFGSKSEATDIDSFNLYKE